MASFSSFNCFSTTIQTVHTLLTSAVQALPIRGSKLGGVCCINNVQNTGSVCLKIYAARDCTMDVFWISL